MFWYCNPEESACIARVDAADKTTADDLSAREQEVFEHAPFPDAFSDYPEQD